MKGRQRPFAVFDIDGTLVRWQLYHAIADNMVKLGYSDGQDYRRVKDARMQWKKRAGSESFRDYEKQLVKVYEGVLKTLTFEQFEDAAKAVFEEYKDQVYTYTRELIRQLKADGYLLFAISGSQLEVVGMIAEYYGFDDWVGTIYERGGKGFSGKVTLHHHGKHIILEELVKKHGATYKDSVAVGDSEGDITILEAADKPIAFNPTRKLYESAKDNGWPIVIERKNMIYKLEPKDGKYILV